MGINRETVYSALFTCLQERIPEVTVWTRRYILSDQINFVDLPAIIVNAEGEDPEGDGNEVTTWTLNALVVILVGSSDEDVTPVEIPLHNLIDKVESAFEYKNGEPIPAGLSRVDVIHTTLKGACRKAWISGRIEKSDGPEGGQAFALVPVSMQVTQ